MVCPRGCRAPVVLDIPRFVLSEDYASSFGLQWKRFRQTQLDSYTGTTISRDRLERCLGGDLAVVRGRRVLEVGCGAGRFTEILLDAGANVFATDLSSAVEANFANCGHRPRYFVCQADAVALPVKTGSFDVVIALGVVQHTPDPERTMQALCSYVAPGGMLVMDHYTIGYAATLPRRILRTWLLHMSPRFSLRFCEIMVAALWPLHALFAARRGCPGVARLRRALLRVSPLVDYHDAYPQLKAEHLRAWAILDTHDTLTDRYKHLRSAEQIADCLRRNGMIDIQTAYAGNGVEARARRPVGQVSLRN